mgnify:CR=1 FL=1|jgi:hypothetical protein|tara:strand:- start:3200 stop:3586 length:387 start_codon:yes stop_codon:yes gene_type:complete
MDNNKNIINKNLSNRENTELKLLNTKSNMLRKIIKKKDDPLNMSIKDFLRNWADTNIYIIVDLTNFISTISKYNTHFNDIDDTNNWISGINSIFAKLYKIFTKKNRAIFVGFTLILISFALYIIQITS